MVKRFNDVPYGTFSFWSDMTVVCPKCGEAGTVHYDKERKTAVFNCGGCFWKNEALPCGDCGFDVTAQCTSTGKYFRTSVPDGKIHGQKIKVRCLYCGELVTGEVADNRKEHIVFSDELQRENGLGAEQRAFAVFNRLSVGCHTRFSARRLQ